MTDEPGPTARRRVLASELRRLRLAAGLTQGRAEELAGLGRTALSRYESCVSSIGVPAAEKLLTVYGVTGPRLERLLDLARGARRRGALKGLRGMVWPPLEHLIALERDASTIRELALLAIPGLLQTPGYAHAILRAGALADEVDQHVRARLGRAESLFGRPVPPEYQVILHEAALRVAIGGAHVMRQQLGHLLDLAQRPEVTIRVLPNQVGAHPSMVAPFVLLGFDLAPESAVVYLDHLTGSLYLDDPEDVNRYDHTHRRLTELALPVDGSLELIRAIRDTHWGETRT